MATLFQAIRRKGIVRRVSRILLGRTGTPGRECLIPGRAKNVREMTTKKIDNIVVEHYYLFEYD